MQIYFVIHFGGFHNNSAVPLFCLWYSLVVSAVPMFRLFMIVSVLFLVILMHLLFVQCIFQESKFCARPTIVLKNIVL